MAPDDLWRQFGIGTRRGPGTRTFVMAWSGVALVVAAAVLSGIGAISPRIRWEVGSLFSLGYKDTNGLLYRHITIKLDNEGLVPFTITDISIDIAGLRLLPPDETRHERTSVTVKGGGRETLFRRVAVTDCAAVPREPQPARFTYRTWLASGQQEAIGESEWRAGAEGGVPIGWQRGIVFESCDVAVSGEPF